MEKTFENIQAIEILSYFVHNLAEGKNIWQVKYSMRGKKYRYHNEVEDYKQQSEGRANLDGRNIMNKRILEPCVKWLKDHTIRKGRERLRCSLEEGSSPRRTPSQMAESRTRCHGDL